MSLKLKHWGFVLKGCRMCLELAKTELQILSYREVYQHVFFFFVFDCFAV